MKYVPLIKGCHTAVQVDGFCLIYIHNYGEGRKEGGKGERKGRKGERRGRKEERKEEMLIFIVVLNKKSMSNLN